jgi:hypothetical protein
MSNVRLTSRDGRVLELSKGDITGITGPWYAEPGYGAEVYLADGQNLQVQETLERIDELMPPGGAP